MGKMKDAVERIVFGETTEEGIARYAAMFRKPVERAFERAAAALEQDDGEDEAEDEDAPEDREYA